MHKLHVYLTASAAPVIIIMAFARLLLWEPSHDLNFVTMPALVVSSYMYIINAVCITVCQLSEMLQLYLQCVSLCVNVVVCNPEQSIVTTGTIAPSSLPNTFNNYTFQPSGF